MTSLDPSNSSHHWLIWHYKNYSNEYLSCIDDFRFGSVHEMVFRLEWIKSRYLFIIKKLNQFNWKVNYLTNSITKESDWMKYIKKSNPLNPISNEIPMEWIEEWNSFIINSYQ